MDGGIKELPAAPAVPETSDRKDEEDIMEKLRAQIDPIQEGNTMGLWLGLWCLTPLSTIVQLYRGGPFISGGN